jgi:hypothetical protein
LESPDQANKKRRLNKLRDITNQFSGKETIQESSSNGRMQFTFYNDHAEAKNVGSQD